MDLIRIRTVMNRGEDGGWLEVSLDEVVCYGKTYPQGPETVWLSNNMIVSVADGTCEMIRRTIHRTHHVEVHDCDPRAAPEPSHEVTAEGLVRVQDGTVVVSLKNDWTTKDEEDILRRLKGD